MITIFNISYCSTPDISDSAPHLKKQHLNGDDYYKYEFLLYYEFKYFITKEPALPQIGQNWHDVKIYGMYTQWMLYSSSVIFFIFFDLHNVYIKVRVCTFNIYDKPILPGIRKKELTNVEIQKQTGSLYKILSEKYVL